MRITRKIKGFALLESVISAVVIGGYVSSMQNVVAEKQLVSDALNMSKSSQVAVVEYFKKNGTLPTNSSQINLPNEYHLKDSLVNVNLGEFGEIILTMENSGALSNKTIVLEPSIKEGAIDWSCTNGSLENYYRPKDCHKNPMNSAENIEKLDSLNDGNYI